MSYDFFISHCREDKINIALPLYWALLSLGFYVWIDRDKIAVGQQIYQTIESAIEDSSFVIAIIAEPYLTREWTVMELQMALELENRCGDSKRSKLLPIYHDVSLAQVTSIFPALSGRAYEQTEGNTFVATQSSGKTIINRIVQQYFINHVIDDRTSNGQLLQHHCDKPHIEPLIHLLNECERQAYNSRLCLISFTNAIRYATAIIESMAVNDKYHHIIDIAKNYVSLLNQECYSFKESPTQDMLLASKAVLQAVLQMLKRSLDTI